LKFIWCRRHGDLGLFGKFPGHSQANFVYAFEARVQQISLYKFKVSIQGNAAHTMCDQIAAQVLCSHG
jgi:hypothetical protein